MALALGAEVDVEILTWPKIEEYDNTSINEKRSDFIRNPILI